MFLLIHFILAQKSILFSSSIGYYNYRQTANIMSIYHKLKHYSFTDQDILLLIPQNSGCCQKNPNYGSVTFIDDQNQEEDNLNKNIQIDYNYNDITLDKVVNLMRQKYNENQLQKNNLSSNNNKKQKLFIYITGHGGDTYFKIRQRQAIIDENFNVLFHDLKSSNKFSSIFLISDSCSAITPFVNVQIQNFTAFGSSDFGQKSQSHGYDSIMNSPKSDDFTYYFIQYLENNNPIVKNITLKEIYNYMSVDKLNVHSKIVGKGKKYLKNINQFIVKKQTITKKMFKYQRKYN